MNQKKVWTVWALCGLATVIVGCGSTSAPGPLLKATVTTNAVPTNAVVVATNAVVTDTGTSNYATGEIFTTNIVTQTNIVPATNYTTVTNYAPAPALASTLSTLSTINTITGPIDPFSGWISLILGASTAGLAFYAKTKTTQAATHASTVQTVLNAVQSLAPDIQPVVTAAIHAEAAKAGTSATVYAALQAATS